MVRFSLLSSFCCLLSWQAVVCGRAPFSHKIFNLVFIMIMFVGLVFYKLLILF